MPKGLESRPSLPALPCACANLRRAARAASQLYDEELRPAGLRVTQFTLLQVLHRAGPIRQGDLGEALALDSTTLSRTLRPLLRAGWIRGLRGADRRERVYALAAAGRREMERAIPLWERAQARLKQRLGAEGWQQLQAALPGVAAAAQSA